MKQHHEFEDLEAYVKERLEQIKLSKTKLADKIGISRSGLDKLLKLNAEKSEFGNIIKLAAAIEVYPFELFRFIFQTMDISHPKSIPSKDKIGFVGETIPDGSIIFVNQVFPKTWTVQNESAEIWKNKRLICLDEQPEFTRRATDIVTPNSYWGLMPNQRSIPVPKTFPGDEAELNVIFTAPAYPCTVRSNWKMVDCNGDFCFPENEPLSCTVKVVSI